MARYIVLVKLNGEAAAQAGELPQIMRWLTDAWNVVGSEAQVHAVQGPYDLVVQGEAREPVDVAWLSAGLAESGVSMCSMQAFSIDDLAGVFRERSLKGYPVRRDEVEPTQTA